MDAREQRRELAAKRRRRRRLGRRLTMLGSGAIGLLALSVSAYTVYVQRQQLKAQVWPRLTVSGSGEYDSDGVGYHFKFVLKNQGVAPAEVRTMSVLLDGEPVTDWVDLIERKGRRIGTSVEGNLKGAGTAVDHVVAAGEDLTLFATESAPLSALTFVEGSPPHLSVCYCSMLEDCWQLEDNMDTSTTSAVPSCRTPTVMFVGWPKDNERKWAARVLDAGAEGGAAVAHDAGTDAERGDHARQTIARVPALLPPALPAR